MLNKLELIKAKKMRHCFICDKKIFKGFEYWRLTKKLDNDTYASYSYCYNCGNLINKLGFKYD